MSGGSAFYVLIYAIFYFVNKVSSFLLYGSVSFPEETVGFGKGNGGTHLLLSVPVSPRQLSSAHPGRVWVPKAPQVLLLLSGVP